jgi:hypothetical protein
MYIFYPILIKFGTADVHKKLLCHCEFHENQQKPRPNFSYECKLKCSYVCTAIQISIFLLLLPLQFVPCWQLNHVFPPFMSTALTPEPILLSVPFMLLRF